jgi:hypothetical protein
MRPLAVLGVTAAALALAAGATSPPAPADAPAPPPPYIDHVTWAKWGDLSSLRVYPTAAGRTESGIGTRPQADEAWAEVLTLSPDADLPGMREQFLCHWQFAELTQPGKTSWNLEPWRPEVDADQMLEAGCNPGGTQEPF